MTGWFTRRSLLPGTPPLLYRRGDAVVLRPPMLSPQGEAAGHAYVQLTGTGQSVQWANDTGQPINFINVRAAIWQYEGNGNYNGSDQNPAGGNPRDFWDEFHAVISGAPIPAGATFSLEKDSASAGGGSRWTWARRRG